MDAILYYVVVFTSLYLALTVLLAALTYVLPRQSLPSLVPFTYRILASYFSICVCALYGVFASIALRLVSQQGLAQYTTGKSYAYAMRYAAGVTFAITPEDEKLLRSKRPIVIIGNHQSSLDVLFLGAIWPPYCSVTAKTSLKHAPFLGWFMQLSGTVFIDRVDRSQAMKAFEGAVKEMKDHRQSVFLFPEGTRSYAEKPTLLPFKKGAFHLAVQAGVDILPVVAENYSKLLNTRRLIFEGGSIRVKVLQPISTKGLTTADVDNLTRDTREKMLRVLEDFAKDVESKSLNIDGDTAKNGSIETKKAM